MSSYGKIVPFADFSRNKESTFTFKPHHVGFIWPKKNWPPDWGWFLPSFFFTISVTNGVWVPCHCRLLACLVGGPWYLAVLLIWLHRHYRWELSWTIHCCFPQSCFIAELNSVCITETLFSCLTLLSCFETSVLYKALYKLRWLVTLWKSHFPTSDPKDQSHINHSH